MPDVNARPWFIAGHLHLGAAAALGAARAAPTRFFDDWTHVLLALAGAFLVAGGLAHGFVAPFLKREPRTRILAHASLALVLVADAVALVGAPLVERVTPRHAWMAYAAAFAILPLHVLLAAFAGREWRGGIALFAKDQPFRHGDRLAAGAFATALVGLLAGAALLAFPPRGLPTAAVAVLLLAFAVPFYGGFLAFLLPRNAKRPLPGLTLHGAGIGLSAGAAVGLALAFAQPLGSDWRLTGIVALLAHAFPLVALRRLELPAAPGPQLRRARPFLRGAYVFALLAPIVLVLATWSGAPQLDLLVVALYLYVLLAASLAVACTLLGAPILLNAVPREGRWGAFASALAILGIFLLAPAFQYARASFPGAAVILAAAALTLWGLAPLRAPRRDCPP